ncbi:MAG: hypothetical protein PHS57_07695 [Alphaproteobacteria bacterium]|nr:hypothetical protein [Alphaproteobacteria bacterium]
MLVRILDVHDGHVVYAFEDSETRCRWEGLLPGIGDVFLIDPDHPGKNARHIASPVEGAWKPDTDVMRWRKPITPGHPGSRMAVLKQRHRIRRSVRDTLDGLGFLEIDVPLLVHGAAPDVSINSFAVDERYLISSAEYQLKRMAVGGFTNIYSLTKNFRQGDVSSVRTPEFTMLEWGRVGGTLRDIENDAEMIVMDALDALTIDPVVSYQGKKINLKTPWDRIPVLEMIERLTRAPMPSFDAASCRRALEAAGAAIRNEWAEDAFFLFTLLMDTLQPRFGTDRPLFLIDWPLTQTLSAAANPEDPCLAQRSELFIGGIEIADGFAGLADPTMQTQLFNNALAQRKSEGLSPVACDQRYLEAMTLGAPFGAGMAMGFDRLVMLLTNQATITPVLAFGWDEA